MAADHQFPTSSTEIFVPNSFGHKQKPQREEWDGPNLKNVKFGPPPRWLRCPRKGFTVYKKFLPFKTPLCDLYDSQVPDLYRFYPKMVFNTNEDGRVGLWIDLTNTKRFYRQSEVEAEGAVYVKYKCRGHGECPSEEQVTGFITLCKEFMRKNPKQIIGVHCTHGFNRTGFLICAYLVTQLNWSLDMAVECFKRARPPGIYKEDYLRELYARYDEGEEVAPEPPMLPDWCDESDPLLDGNEAELEPAEISNSEGGKNDANNSDGESEEKRAGAPQFMDGLIPSVTLVKNAAERHRLQTLTRKWTQYRGKGFPGSQPVSMEFSPKNKNLEFLSQKPYKVSWKADGVRYLMLIEGADKIYMFDRDNRAFQVPNLQFPKRKDTNLHVENTLVDGEMIVDEVNGQKVPRYLIYDVVRFEDQETGKCAFDKRLECIRFELVEPRRQQIALGKIDRNLEPFSVRNKDFWDITTVEKILGATFSKQISHEVDGLVFQPCPEPYKAGRCDTVLKWKPPHLNTVDFKLNITTVSGTGMLKEKKGELWVLNYERAYAEIKLNRDLMQYHGKIIECSFDNGQWKFLRERTDKSHPNGFETAVSVCCAIKFPITKERLIEYINKCAIKPKSNLLPPSSGVKRKPGEVPTFGGSMPPPSKAPPKK